MNNTKLVYVKYANRKFYSKQNKAYATLPEIFDEVKRGNDVQVIDNVTKNDITVQSLASSLTTVSIPTESVVAFIRGLQ